MRLPRGPEASAGRHRPVAVRSDPRLPHSFTEGREKRISESGSLLLALRSRPPGQPQRTGRADSRLPWHHIDRFTATCNRGLVSSSRHGSRVPKIYITLAEIYELDNGEMNFQEKLRPQAEFLQALNRYLQKGRRQAPSCRSRQRSINPRSGSMFAVR